jgi:ubiquinone/menaquinone biosynthesis C-methylase UbiE
MSGLVGILVAQESKQVMQQLQVRPEDQVLDVGCGSGYYSQLISQAGGDPYGIDASPAMIAELKKKGLPGSVENIETVNMDIKFDKVICAGVLEFVSDMNASIKNIHSKLLKNQGRLVILYPTYRLFGILYLFYHRLHGIKVKLISLKGMEEILVRNNFRIIFHKKVGIMCNIVTAIQA